MTRAIGDMTEGGTVLASLADLCEGFVNTDQLPAAVEIARADALPEPWRSLLVHTNHMTTTLETFHGQPVDLHVLDQSFENDIYRRMILLSLENSKQVAEFGIVRMHLGLVSPVVRQEILDQSAPLGDILIRHNVLRRVEPGWYFRCLPGCPFTAHFQSDRTHPAAEAFGRVGVITCDNQPAIELVEVVTGAAPS